MDSFVVAVFVRVKQRGIELSYLSVCIRIYIGCVKIFVAVLTTISPNNGEGSKCSVRLYFLEVMVNHHFLSR